MAICYKCKNEITATNKSLEHIIPNALGGRLKSENLLCKPCNSDLGTEVDAVLSEHIPFGLLLNVKRDKGKHYRIIGKDENGKEFYITIDPKTNELVAEQKTEKPHERSLENGKKAVKFTGFETGKKYLENIKKNIPSFDIKNALAQVRWERERGERKFTFFEEQLKGYLANRALSKIGLEYFLHAGGYPVFVEDLIQIVFANAQIENGGIGTYYYQHHEDSIISLGEDEVSHTLYLKGDPESKTLFCYIELFSIYKYVVILSKNYSGVEIESLYCYDLLKQQNLSNEKTVSFVRNEPLIHKFSKNEMIDAFKNSKLRVMNIAGLKYQ